MNSLAARTSAILVTIILLVTGVACVPSASADGEPEYGEYGATVGMDYDRLDSIVNNLTGKTIAQWLQDLVNTMEGYYIEEAPIVHFSSEFAISRDTTQIGTDYTMHDHYSGWINAKFDGEATGTFPDAGTYYPLDGESNNHFLKRVFTEECTGDSKDIYIHSSIRMYIDLDLVSHVDLSTGELTDSYITLKFAIYEDTDRNISFVFKLDENDNLEYLTFGYDVSSGDSNFFLDFEIALTISDLPIFREGTWTVYPSITEHVNKSVVSSDLADSLWLKMVAMSNEIQLDAKLPSLILELLGSGGRMMDLFGTIKSLTGKELSDLTFTDVLDAEMVSDGYGYWYCQLVSQNPQGNTYNLPKAAYVLKLSDLVGYIPDSILDPDLKNKLVLILSVTPWADVDVKDISGSAATKEKIALITAHVNKMIMEDNVESYSIPAEYIYISIGGIIASAVVIILMWRRKL